MSPAGIDLGSTWLRAAEIDAQGVVRKRIAVRTPEDPRETAEALASIWTRLGARGRVAAACAPELDSDGVVRRWPSRPRFEGARLLDALRERAEVGPVLDDASAGALGEHLAASRRCTEPSTTVYLAVGSGIGGGAVLEDRLWLGAGGRAMDVGHMPVPSAEGLACGCGRRGCLQAAASGRRLERLASEIGLDVAGLLAAAREGDADARVRVDSLLPPLVEALLVLESVFAPDRIVVGGGVMSEGALFVRLSERAAAAGCRAPILPSRWGTWSGALGAAVCCARLDGTRLLRLIDETEESGHRFALVQGPNLDAVGTREVEQYGTVPMATIEARVVAAAERRGCSVCCVQSNSEAELIAWVRREGPHLDGAVVNPGALTRDGRGLLEALTSIGLPFVEVHLSNIDAREAWHRESCFAAAAVGRISGLRGHGYELALEALETWCRGNPAPRGDAALGAGRRRSPGDAEGRRVPPDPRSLGVVIEA